MFWFAASLAACNVIGERDISCDHVKLLTPPDSAAVVSGVINFKWEEVPDALEYELQIVTPNFIEPLSYVSDTVLDKSSFSKAINPGTVTWRVRALNAGSKTGWSMRTLFVDTTAGLEGVQVDLISPQDGFISADQTLEFSWSAVDGAEYYTWQLLYNQSGKIGEVYLSEQPQSNELSMQIPDGTWFWRVQGEVFGGTPSDFDIHSLIVDTGSPNAATPTYPDGDVVNSPVSFEWSSGTDALTAVTERVKIYSDVEGANLVYSSGEIVSPGSVDLSSLDPGLYYWSVLTTDEAGNAIESELFGLELE
ncbi:MAG: hypothetical protein KDC12_09555 [Flavobacteriales bacterium]|nr:hypothetical protein [Flavobacteriales bacterium]